jgi:UDP-N-acetylmuramate--alanine ligase
MASVPEQGYMIACNDDARIRNLLGTHLKARTISGYGLGPKAEWRAVNLKPNAQGGTNFAVEHKGKHAGNFSIRLPGEHNVSNALAAIVASSFLGIEGVKVRQTLASFQGARRRFEIKGEMNGITVVDDYAHHPTEIKATLKAARTRFGNRRIICVFQPHTYSRTKFLFEEFTTAFADADEVIITDIYAAREHDTLGISAADLAAALRHPLARYIGDLKEVVERELECLQPGDVLMTVGAGDVDRVSNLVLEGLAQR